MLPEADLAGLPPALPDLSSAACGTSGAGLWGQQPQGMGGSDRFFLFFFLLFKFFYGWSDLQAIFLK